jgi:epoxyqueuosine reductase QueG
MRHVNRVDSKRKVSQVFNYNLNGSRIRGRSKNRWLKCIQKDIKNVKEVGKRGQKTELRGKSPLRRSRSALDCSAIEEEKEEEGLGKKLS